MNNLAAEKATNSIMLAIRSVCSAVNDLCDRNKQEQINPAISKIQKEYIDDKRQKLQQEIMSMKIDLSEERNVLEQMAREGRNDDAMHQNEVCKFIEDSIKELEKELELLGPATQKDENLIDAIKNFRYKNFIVAEYQLDNIDQLPSLKAVFQNLSSGNKYNRTIDFFPNESSDRIFKLMENVVQIIINQSQSSQAKIATPILKSYIREALTGLESSRVFVLGGTAADPQHTKLKVTNVSSVSVGGEATWVVIVGGKSIRFAEKEFNECTAKNEVKNLCIKLIDGVCSGIERKTVLRMIEAAARTFVSHDNKIKGNGSQVTTAVGEYDCKFADFQNNFVVTFEMKHIDTSFTQGSIEKQVHKIMQEAYIKLQSGEKPIAKRKTGQTWKTKDGREMDIGDMESSHLNNLNKWMEKNKPDHRRRPIILDEISYRAGQGDEEFANHPNFLGTQNKDKEDKQEPEKKDFDLDDLF
jgi:hypothetical protein